MKIAIIVIILILLLMGLILWLPSQVLTAKRKTYDEAFAWAGDHYDTSFYGEVEKNDYSISSYDGYELHVELLKNPILSAKYVIITHGITDNLKASLKYARFYLDLGFNCIIYDLRGHGMNEPSHITYGIKESRDLLCLIKDTRERYPDISLLGLHGESLGSATSVTCLKYKPEVDFVVADCGFSEITNVLKGTFKSPSAASIPVALADIGARIRYHCSFREMRPIDALADNEIPVLYIHGAIDTLISPDNSEDMHKATKAYSECHIIPGAKHAMSAVVEPGMYTDILKNFLNRVTNA